MPFGIPDLTPPAGFELPVINHKPRKPGTYGRGNPPPSKGRRPGQINKITADLKQGILRGAANCGYDGAGQGGVDGFLLYCAQRHPKAYLALLGKMLPLNLTASVDSSRINEVRIVSVPANHYLSSVDIEKLQSPMTVEAQPIEHTPQPEQHDEPAAIVQAIEPPGEARLIAELSNLSVGELMRRAEELARQAGVSLVVPS